MGFTCTLNIINLCMYFPVSHQVEKNEGMKLVAQQFYAMLLKRIIYTWRNKILTLSQVILPLLFTALTIAIMKTLPSSDGSAKKLPFNLDMYGKTTVSHDSGCKYIFGIHSMYLNHGRFNFNTFWFGFI